MHPDQSITYLKSFGYTVLRLPRPDTKPLQVLQRKGKDLTRLGDLTDLMQGGSLALPGISPDNRNGDISGKESSKMEIGIGLTILGNLISAMGGSNLGLEASYKNAKTMNFQFADVLENSVSLVKLEQYLNAARIRPESSQGLRERLLNDEVYVITSTIKSKKFITDAQADRGTGVDLSVPVINQAVGGKVKVTTEGGLTGKVGYEGDAPLVFGVQAVQLFFDDTGQFITADPLKAGDGAVRGRPPGEGVAERGSSQQGPVYLSVEGALARLE